MNAPLHLHTVVKTDAQFIVSHDADGVTLDVLEGTPESRLELLFTITRWVIASEDVFGRALVRFLPGDPGCGLCGIVIEPEEGHCFECSARETRAWLLASGVQEGEP